MNIYLIIGIIVFWGIGATISYGKTFKCLQDEFPSLAKEDYSEDRLFAIFISIFSWKISWINRR